MATLQQILDAQKTLRRGPQGDNQLYINLGDGYQAAYSGPGTAAGGGHDFPFMDAQRNPLAAGVDPITQLYMPRSELERLSTDANYLPEVFRPLPSQYWHTAEWDPSKGSMADKYMENGGFAATLGGFVLGPLAGQLAGAAGIGGNTLATNAIKGALTSGFTGGDPIRGALGSLSTGGLLDAAKGVIGGDVLAGGTSAINENTLANLGTTTDAPIQWDSAGSNDMDWFDDLFGGNGVDFGGVDDPAWGESWRTTAGNFPDVPDPSWGESWRMTEGNFPEYVNDPNWGATWRATPGNMPNLWDSVDFMKAGGGLAGLLNRMRGTGSSGAGGTGEIDLLRMLGLAIPGAIGAFAANQQAKSLADLAGRFEGYGAPSRARYEASFDPNFDPRSMPGYSGALESTSDAILRRLSVGSGNPFGDPGGLIEANKAIVNGTALPALNEYRRVNAGAGGLANLSAAYPQTLTAATGAERGVWDALGAGAADIFTPKRTLADLLGAQAYTGVGGPTTAEGKRLYGLYGA